MWLDKITVIPFGGKERINSRSSSMPTGSRPLVGSSRIKSCGLFSKAMAMPRPLLHTKGKLSGPLLPRIGQTDDVQDFINPIIRQSQHRCPHFQIFVCGQVFVQGRRFNQCTDLCQIAALPRMAVKLNTAGSGPQNTCNHF